MGSDLPKATQRVSGQTVAFSSLRAQSTAQPLCLLSDDGAHQGPPEGGAGPRGPKILEWLWIREDETLAQCGLAMALAGRTAQVTAPRLPRDPGQLWEAVLGMRWSSQLPLKGAWVP